MTVMRECMDFNFAKIKKIRAFSAFYTTNKIKKLIRGDDHLLKD